MSMFFGEIRQFAFVVKDLKKTMDYWTKVLGVGPFFVIPELTPENYKYRGQSAKAPRGSFALGFSGKIQIELIQPLDENPSTYSDFLQSGRQGCHHVSSWVSKTEYDQYLKQAEKMGVVPVQEGVVPGTDLRYCCLDTNHGMGEIYQEIADLKDGPFYQLFMKMEKISSRQ